MRHLYERTHTDSLAPSAPHIRKRTAFNWASVMVSFFLVGLAFSIPAQAQPAPSAKAAVQPTAVLIAQNFPNPFSERTTVRFTLPEEARVQLRVYDMLGRSVKVLVDEPLAAGTHEASWNATDEKEAPVQPGLYLYRIEAGEARITRTMVVLPR